MQPLGNEFWFMIAAVIAGLVWLKTGMGPLEVLHRGIVHLRAILLWMRVHAVRGLANEAKYYRSCVDHIEREVA